MVDRRKLVRSSGEYQQAFLFHSIASRASTDHFAFVRDSFHQDSLASKRVDSISDSLRTSFQPTTLHGGPRLLLSSSGSCFVRRWGSVRGGRARGDAFRVRTSRRTKETRRADLSSSPACVSGQKARIGLARAVYSQARHLVLDDCLSAVDGELPRFRSNHRRSPDLLLLFLQPTRLNDCSKTAFADL